MFFQHHFQQLKFIQSYYVFVCSFASLSNLNAEIIAARSVLMLRCAVFTRYSGKKAAFTSFTMQFWKAN